MNWTCPQIEERLSDYLEDALSVADRNAFQAHVHQCAQCRPLLAGVSGLVTAMHQVEPVEPPAGLVYRILEQTRPQERAGWFGLAWLSPRLAMGGVTMALAVLMVWPVLNNDLQNLTWSDLKPANLYHSVDRRATLLYARGVKFVNGLRVLHEIQSRLQPAGDPRAVPVKEELKKDSDDHQNKSEDKKKLEQNHALEPRQLPVMLAWMVGSLPGGAIR